MSRTLFGTLLAALLLSSLQAGEKGWDHFLALSLKKDIWQSVEIREGERVHNLDLCWTLYKNGGLVMQIKYDKYRYQPLLYAKFRLDTFKIDLFPKREDASRSTLQKPYALIVFKAFDERKREAHIDLMIKDYGMSEIFYEKGKE